MKSVEKAGFTAALKAKRHDVSFLGRSDAGHPPPGPRPRQPAGHRQHRQRGPDRARTSGSSGCGWSTRRSSIPTASKASPTTPPTSWRGSRSCDSLEAAVADCVLVAVLTARERAAKRRTLRPREAAAELVEQAAAGRSPSWPGGRTGASPTPSWISGTLLVTIPTDPRNSSLNLAQAVAIMAYETWLARGGEVTARSSRHRKRGRAGDRGPAGGALRRLGPGALGHRLLQDPALGERDAFVPGDRVPGGARRTGSVPGPRDGHRGGALPGRVGAPAPECRRPNWDGHERSNAYWAANRYPDESVEPEPDAPLDGSARRRWPPASGLREGLLELPEVGETGALHGCRPGAGPGSTESETGRSAGCMSCGDAVSRHLHPDRDRGRPAAARRPARRRAGAGAGRGPAHRAGQVVLAGAGRPAGRGGLSPLRPAEGRVARGAAGSPPRAHGWARAEPRRGRRTSRLKQSEIGQVRLVGLCTRLSALYFGALEPGREFPHELSASLSGEIDDA